MDYEWNVAINKAIVNNAPKVEKILRENPYINDLAADLREKKLDVLNNIDRYIKQTEESVLRSGGGFHLARDSNDAIDIVRKIIGDKKNIVLSKSNVLYEIKLRETLASEGRDIWETDLGEYLVQINNDMPSHLIAPAIHLTKEKVGKILNENLDKSIDENSKTEDMVHSVREFLMKKYLAADVGITGANAVSADSGSVILVENEGNIRMDTVLPGIHIAITGIDKIVPTLKDAFNEAIVQAANAGFYPPTYINVSSGPSSTGDIELKKVTPATGPREFHLILVDNGRSDAIKSELMESLLCIRCGRCYFSCPAYRLYGKDFGTSPYTGPTGIMWSAIIFKEYDKSEMCMHSGGCGEVCPMKIPIPKIIEKIKFRYTG
ncbi:MULTISPECIES: LUD domain-containing protein [Acidiplasma]|uniref:(Fe-S)-binding protein n=1 Tax=Acidiplasma cupricumulans TaxID=312540 RepID=A0A0N8VLH6_9ARCH|nr:MULTISPECIES: lactate utilization protein B [Acidiplasma]KJE49209.1 (Fe-S)-binding protein [Acidiplasma sp. MBA-1]KQB36548.1 (Fe-S)-binding protein [Acidiplasma cupricumulans]WMT54834.1 MAG: lactate utilization protein B [Acidiplasma sp.]